MQRPFSCIPHVLQEIESIISPARLVRFTPPNGNKHHGLRLYIWNARLCEEFYLPLQMAEVSIRNVIAGMLKSHYGSGWYSNKAVEALLPSKYAEELPRTVIEQQTLRARYFTGDHVVAAMSFGFWVNWLTSRYEGHFWRSGVAHAFPHAPAAMTRHSLHRRINQLKDFRNRVAHHYAIFDRSPLQEYKNLEEIVEWISPSMLWLIRELASPARVINERPPN